MPISNSITKSKKSRGHYRDKNPTERRSIILSIVKNSQAETRRVCRGLDIPRSSFYKAAKETSRQIFDREIGDQIETIFHLYEKRYGYRRISEQLDDLGIECAPARVRKLMKKKGLVALQPRSFKPVTRDGKANAPAPGNVP